MGWWSKTIMGGDAPCDAYAAFDELVGEKAFGELKDDFDPQTITADMVNECLDDMFAFVDNVEYGHTIYSQVIGVYIMQHGAKMPSKIRTMALNGAKDDSWAEENEERASYIQQFIEALTNYPEEGGCVVELPNEGLFEVIFNDLIAEKLTQQGSKDTQ